MLFTTDRQKLVPICRNLARLLPDTSPIADLTGILVEADENTGSIQLAATNLETSLRYSCDATVHEGGRMVVNGRLLADMVALLGQEQVSFQTAGATVRVQSGKAYYAVACLEGKHYPDGKMDHSGIAMAQVSGIASLAKQTVFAVSRQKKAGVLGNAKLDIFPGEVHMTCTDGSCLAVVRQKQEGNGTLSVLIPAKSLHLLTGVSGDEPAKVGLLGNSLVFTGSNYVFITRITGGVYPEVGQIIAQTQPVYSALVDSRDLLAGIDLLETVTVSGDRISLALKENGIDLSFQGEYDNCKTLCEAVIYQPMPGNSFYYNIGELGQVARSLNGTVRLGIEQNGVLLLRGENQCYLFVPRRVSTVVPPKTKKRKSPANQAKKTDQKSKTAKAA